MCVGAVPPRAFREEGSLVMSRDTYKKLLELFSRGYSVKFERESEYLLFRAICEGHGYSYQQFGDTMCECVNQLYKAVFKDKDGYIVKVPKGINAEKVTLVFED
jgi:hypothetical protein